MNELGGIMMAQGRAGAAVAAGRAGGEPGDGAAGAAAAGPGIMTRDQHEVAGHLTEVRFALEELSRLGGDTGDIKEAVANAETALMEGNPGKSLDILDKAGANVQERLEDVYRVRAQEALKTVRIMVEKRKADGSSSPALEAGLADMLDVYRNGGLEGLRTLRAKADELTQRNKAELEVQVQEELTRRAAQVTVKVAEVMEQGGQIVEVDNLLQMANAARSKGDIGEASALINRAEQEVDEVWLLMKRTDMLVELESIRWMFLKLKKAGANVAQMGSAIVAATKALERAEVDKAASFCARARTLLNSTTGPFMEQLVHINIQELKAIAVEFQAGGEDPALLLGLIQKAESELGSGDISGAMVSTVGAKGIVGRRELEESTGKQHEQVSRIKVRILHLADGGLDMKVPLTLHTELVQSLRKGRMDEVQRGMENLLHLVNDIQAGFSKERAKEIISTVERLLGHLHKHHPDSAVHTANGEVILKNARKMMDDITDEEISGVTQAFLYGRVEEAIEELEELISYLKKHNIAKEEVGAVEGYLQQARDLRADRGRILDAEAAIQKGSAAGLRLKNDYLRNKVVKALNRFTALVEQGRKAGKDTSKVESVCRKAREHMKRLDFEAALVELEKLAGR
jgi:tetratricopeptide (TPR) repeat protein